METDHTSDARVADYLRPLASRWWLILVAVVVATGAVYVYYAHKPDVYTTSTLVYFQQPGDPVTGEPTPEGTDREVLDEATLLDSRETAAAVARRIRYGGTLEALLQQVSLTSKPGEDFVEVTTRAGTAQGAADVANAFARQLVASLDGVVTSHLRSELTTSKDQLAQLHGGSGNLQYADLVHQIDEIQLALKAPTTVATQVNPALPPGAPASPKPKRNALFAFVLSLVGAIALCYGLERFDRRLRNPEEMERAYGRSLLAVLPHTADPKPLLRGGAALSFDFREPFRILRTNVELESLDAPPRTIIVSSAMPGEGKSTVVRNLALAFREAGRSVVVVDLDLRHPTLPKQFAVEDEDGPGMTEVLRHDVTLDDALRDVPVGLLPFDAFMKGAGRKDSNGNGSNGHGDLPEPEITLLLSGARPANPAGVLSSERVVEVLDELRERFDIVIVDTAPVLAVTDTVPLLRYADGSIFVSRLDVTTRDTAKRLLEFLERLPDLNLLGFVANDLSRIDAGGYGYGYGYGYGGTYSDEPVSVPRRVKLGRQRSKQSV